MVSRDAAPSSAYPFHARRNDARARTHPGYWAFIVHRLSGIALAVFLPIHFVVLAQAIAHPATLNAFLDWTRQPAVKLAETLLVLALVAHMAGGVRLLFIEFVGWRADWQKTALALAAALALGCALLFALV